MATGFWQDVKYAVRSYAKARVFTATVLIGLGLGIGANTAVFSVVSAQLLRPLPYSSPEELVTVRGREPGRDDRSRSVSYADFLDLSRERSVIASAGVWSVNGSMTLSGVDLPQKVDVASISSGLLPTLQVTPLLGRIFLPEEDGYGAPKTVLLSQAFWKERFAESSQVLGRMLVLDGESFEIVGVMPQGFRFPYLVDEVDLWISLGSNFPSPDAMENRKARYLQVAARLTPHATLEQADSVARTVASRLEKERPETNQGYGLEVEPLRNRFISVPPLTLWVLLATVVAVLLIACANTASMLLARFTQRQGEMAVRVALGASTPRIIRQLFTEALVLGIAAGVVGLALCALLVPTLSSLLPNELKRIHDIRIDGTVLAFTFALSILVTLVLGVAPASVAARELVHPLLKTSTHSRWLRDALLVFQSAFALALLAAAGLLLRSAFELSKVDPGFDAEGLVSARILLTDKRYQEEDSRALQLNRRMIEQLRAIPGVLGATTAFPSAFGRSAVMRLPVEVAASSERTDAHFVGPDYFSVIRAPIVRGRGIGAEDGATQPKVVVVNESFAARHWPGEDPLQKRIGIFWDDQRVDAQVVGVVRDIRHLGLDAEPVPEIYTPSEQWPLAATVVLVRSGLPSGVMLQAIREQLKSVDPSLAVDREGTLSALIALSVEQRRFNTALLSLFALVAVLLAMLGVYGVTAYAVSMRKHEMGIRMALGAQGGQVISLIVRSTLRLTVFGIALGLFAIVMLSDLLKGMVYGLSTTDPLTLAVMVALFVLLALLASYLPARRAARGNVFATLNAE